MQPASDKAPSSSNALRRWGPLALIVVILFGIARRDHARRGR